MRLASPASKPSLFALVLLASLIATGCPTKDSETGSDDTTPDDTDADVDLDEDGVMVSEGDCNDSNPAINPGATEICDGIDNDCDLIIDEDVLTTWHADVDSDTFGDPNRAMQACDQPTGYVADGTDCDDDDLRAFPGNTEVCDSADNDCNGNVDEGLTTTFYTDGDGDGFGDSTTAIQACVSGPGMVTQGMDCDDTNDASYPGAVEFCDGSDNDCDGDVDESGSLYATIWFLDGDSDGYGNEAVTMESCERPSSYVSNSLDCDDASASTSPGAPELCDGADNNCNVLIDDGAMTDWYTDSDSDGYGDRTLVTLACEQPVGSSDNGEDCDDSDAGISPAALEYCNGIDDNCNVSIDEGQAADAPTWYADRDIDSYGDPRSTAVACSAPAGYLADPNDCNDADATIHPGASEVCDSVDQNCNGIADDNSTDAPTWYVDADADSYGNVSVTVRACAAPAGYVALSTDCDDQVRTIHPSATEHCDGVDENCNGLTDDGAVDFFAWYADSDVDGFGDPLSSLAACAEPAGYVADSSDCEPTDPNAFPGATTLEVPFDGVDEDCDGNDFCTDLDCDGQPDLILPSYHDATDTDSLSLVSSLAWEVDLPTSGARKAVAADFDLDGYQDLLFVNSYSDATASYEIASTIYWGSATGYSTSDTSGLAGLGARDALVDDLNGDSWPDVVLANSQSSLSMQPSSYVYWGSATGFSTASRVSLPTKGAVRVVSGDLNVDGFPDLVFCDHYNGNYAVNSYVYWGSATGYASSSNNVLPTMGCKDVAIADFNKDGWPDLAFANAFDGSSYNVDSVVYHGSSTGFSSARLTSLPTAGSEKVDAVDVNNDGWVDLVFGGFSTATLPDEFWQGAGSTYVYYNSSNGFSGNDYDALTTTGGHRQAVADLDGDGFADIVVPMGFNGASYTPTSYIFWGSASGYLFSDRSDLDTEGPTAVVIGDWSQDGVPDLIFNGYDAIDLATQAESWAYIGASTGWPLFDELDSGVIGGWGTWATPVLVGPSGW